MEQAMLVDRMTSDSKMHKHHCLATVNYHGLRTPRKPPPTTHPTPGDLAGLACDKIISSGSTLVIHAVTNMPCHLAASLFKAAVNKTPIQPAIITALLANYPLHTLCFRDILDADHQDIFLDELGFDLMVFRGITSRTEACMIRCIDLRGFKLNWTFTRLIVQMWPILSLRKSQRSVKRLTNTIIKKAGLKKENRLSWDIIPHLIRDLLKHEMMTHPRFGIYLPKGETMEVYLDKVEFGHQNTFFMDYLLSSCLRDLTPLKITSSNIIINSELSVGESFLDSLAPFIVFRGHDNQSLSGLCIENLEDSVFYATSSNISRFTHLRSLALLNCNICLQEGRTRRRTATRAHLTTLLSSLPHLARLDLSQNSFTGCLGEILASLQQPLEFLAIRDCDLCDGDMDALMTSHHAASLRELNVSRVCGLFPDDTFAVTTAKLIHTLQAYTKLKVLWISQNQVVERHIDSLCSTIRCHLPELAFLHLPDNLLSPAGALKVVSSCCARPNLQFVHVAFAENILDPANLAALDMGPDNFQRQVETTLKAHRRPDLVVSITSLSYALFNNL